MKKKGQPRQSSRVFILNLIQETLKILPFRSSIVVSKLWLCKKTAQNKSRMISSQIMKASGNLRITCKNSGRLSMMANQTMQNATRYSSQLEVDLLQEEVEEELVLDEAGVEELLRVVVSKIVKLSTLAPQMLGVWNLVKAEVKVKSENMMKWIIYQKMMVSMRSRSVKVHKPSSEKLFPRVLRELLRDQLREIEMQKLAPELHLTMTTSPWKAAREQMVKG